MWGCRCLRVRYRSYRTSGLLGVRFSGFSERVELSGDKSKSAKKRVRSYMPATALLHYRPSSKAITGEPKTKNSQLSQKLVLSVNVVVYSGFPILQCRLSSLE